MLNRPARPRLSLSLSLSRSLSLYEARHWAPMATDPHILELQAARKVPEVEILDPRGAKLFVQGAVPKLVGQEGQFGFTEGPVWVPSKSAWIFSDIPNARQYEYSPGADILTDYRNPSGNSNGNFLSNDGELLTCEHANRLLSSTDFTSGVRTTLAKEYNGVELTSPNDVIQSRKTGHIYFTDPVSRAGSTTPPSRWQATPIFEMQQAEVSVSPDRMLLGLRHHAGSWTRPATGSRNLPVSRECKRCVPACVRCSDTHGTPRCALSTAC